VMQELNDRNKYQHHIFYEIGKQPAPPSREERQRWLSMLYFIERDRGYRRNWARVNYREKLREYPPYGSPIPPMEPTPDVLSWVCSRQIAYAKAKQKAAAA
jgi:DNA repair protein RadD